MQSNEEVNIVNLKRYLLGSLPPPETEAIDLQIIADGSEEQFLWAESELMEDYLDDALSPSDIKLFEENFLVSLERAAQLKQISLMRSYARTAATKASPIVAVAEPPPKNLLEKLKIFGSLNWRPTTAVLALLIVGLFAVFYFTASSRTNSEKEFAAINQKDLSDLNELKPLTNLSLMVGVYRNSGDVQKLTQTALTEKVLFRLALPSRFNAPEKFKAELITGGKVAFTIDDLPFYNNPYGQELRLLLPAAALKKGAHQIKLTRETGDESAFVFNFAVE